MSRKCPKCYLTIGDFDDCCPNCGANTPIDPAVQSSVATNGDASELGGWFKFIINFQIFGTSLLTLWTAYQSYMGSKYLVEKEYVYGLLPDLKTMDLICLVGCVLLVAFAIFVRFQLSGSYSRGPKLYIAYLAGSIALPLACVDAFAKINPNLEVLWYPAGLAAVLFGIFLIIGIFYFYKNRKYFIY